MTNAEKILSYLYSIENFPVTHKQMAEKVGTSLGVINTLKHRLTKNKLIQKNPGYFVATEEGIRIGKTLQPEVIGKGKIVKEIDWQKEYLDLSKQVVGLLEGVTNFLNKQK